MGVEMDEGRYLYAIMRTDQEEFLGAIGLDRSEVWTVPYGDVAAAIHRCQARPYVSEAESQIKDWVIEHSYVIDVATERFGTVLPFSFDVILRGDDEVVRGWIERRHAALNSELERLNGKAEYTVQLFCDESALEEAILKEDQDLAAQKESIKSRPRGSSYLLQRGVEMHLRDAVRSRMNQLEEEMGRLIEDLADEMKDKPRKTILPDERFKGMRLVANICCLLSDESVAPLGRALDDLNSRKGLAVRFTGPWAPFNFARLPEES